MKALVCLAAISTVLLSFSISASVPIIASYVKDGCMVPLGISEHIKWSPSCMPTASFFTSAIIDIPARILNWGSGGRGGLAWRFKETQCNDFFALLQFEITKAFPTINETPHDLFHAHLITFNPKELSFVAVFHAKEYPRDIERIKNYYQVADESFVSTDKIFLTRNFIYMGSDLIPGVPRDIYLLKNQGSCQELFAPHSINTLAESQVAASLGGSLIGDVNIFDPRSLVRIKYNNYYDVYGGEAVNSGKSAEQRIRLNSDLEHWLKEFDAKKLVYFLTGYKEDHSA